MINDTDGHCSYCDNCPLEYVDRTIDHFLPKPVHHHEAYTWSNLYLACMKCQDYKGVHESHLLLRVDDVNYVFNDYFMIDHTTFELKPNLIVSQDNQERAVKKM